MLEGRTQITILAVFHYEVVVDFVPETIFKLHYKSVLQGVVNLLLVFIECLVVLPDDLQDLG